jgi:hypothetical protein
MAINPFRGSLDDILSEVSVDMHEFEGFIFQTHL